MTIMEETKVLAIIGLVMVIVCIIVFGALINDMVMLFGGLIAAVVYIYIENV